MTAAGGLRQLPGLNETYESAALVRTKIFLINNTGDIMLQGKYDQVSGLSRFVYTMKGNSTSLFHGMVLFDGKWLNGVIGI